MRVDVVARANNAANIIFVVFVCVIHHLYEMTQRETHQNIKHALRGALASSWTCKTSKAQGKNLDSYINMYVHVHIYM